MKLQVKMWVLVIFTTIIYSFLIPDKLLALIIPVITLFIAALNKFIAKIFVKSPLWAWFKGFVLANIFLVLAIIVLVSMEQGFDLVALLTTFGGLVIVLLVIYLLAKIIDKNISDS